MKGKRGKVLFTDLKDIGNFDKVENEWKFLRNEDIRF